MNKKLPEWFGKKRIVNTSFDNTSTEIIKWEEAWRKESRKYAKKQMWS